MEIVHVRGRVVRGVRAYFMTRYDASQRGGRGELLGSVDTRFELDVDGRRIAIELAPDIESHNRGRYLGPFRDARNDWDDSFPFETSPTGSDESEIHVIRYSFDTGDDLDVWGEVLETELAAAGYRDAPSTTPTVLRARAIDVPVRAPPIVTPLRIGFLLVLAAIAAVAVVPMGPYSPFARFWSLLVLSIAVSRTHWNVVPDATSSRIWSDSAVPALVLLWVHIAIGITLAMPVGTGFPSWIDELACGVLATQAFTSLYVRWRRMRRLREVAHRLGQGGELGIVRAIANRTDDISREVVAGDALDVMFDREERTILLVEVIFDSHSEVGPRPGTRVLVGNGALYASWENPRAELDHILLWDGRLRWGAAALGLVLPIIAYLAYQAPRIAS